MKKGLFYILVVFFMQIVVLVECSSHGLNNQEAANLVKSSLRLPQTFREEINGAGMDLNRDKLETAGYISKDGSLLYGYNLSVTDKGKPYYLGMIGTDNMYGKNIIGFKSFDITLDSIKDIIINKDQQTVTVSFSLKAINITPIGRLIQSDLDAPKIGNIVFRKSGNGEWQLDAQQNLPSSDLLKRIIWPNRNN